MKQTVATLAAALALTTATAEAGELAGSVQVTKGEPANIVVYVDGLSGKAVPPARRPEINHLNLQFQPARMALMKGTTVDFPNSDPVLHSAFSVSKSNPFELGIYGKGHEKFFTFDQIGEVEIFCHIHGHMRADVLVLDHSNFTATDPDGRFAFANVPDGTYKVTAWINAATQETKTVTVKGKQVSVDFTLNPMIFR
jgi:plastocyanin